MKNIKKISAVLSAVTIMGTCGVTTVSAVDNENTESVSITDSKKDDTDSLSDVIDNYIRENKIMAGVLTYINTDDIVIVYMSEDVKKVLMDFINKNNYDSNLITFRLPSEIDCSEELCFIKYHLYELAEENNIRIDFSSTHYTTEENRYELIIYYYYKHTDVPERIRKFMSDNNLIASGNNSIKFEAVGDNIPDADSKITDPDEIYNLLLNFISEQKLSVESIEILDLYKVAVTINDYWTHEDSKTPIQKFIKENNLNENVIDLLELDNIKHILGDANEDNNFDIRDCAYIASMISQSKSDELPRSADFNGDEVVNIRDAAAVAKNLASAEN